jgi:hypothetical protein
VNQVTLITADVMAGLSMLPDESVHCCVTSLKRSTPLPEDKGPHISGCIHPRKQGWGPAGGFRSYSENSGIQESLCGVVGPAIEVYETPEHLMLEPFLLARKEGEFEEFQRLVGLTLDSKIRASLFQHGVFLGSNFPQGLGR